MLSSVRTAAYFVIHSLAASWFPDALRKRQINRDVEKENRVGWFQDNHPAR